MSEVIFSIFPSKNFIDLGLYQFGWEHCEPSHSFGPAMRNHFLFHYVISGTGTLIAENSKKESISYSIKSGQIKSAPTSQMLNNLGNMFGLNLMAFEPKKL